MPFEHVVDAGQSAFVAQVMFEQSPAALFAVEPLQQAVQIRAGFGGNGVL